MRIQMFVSKMSFSLYNIIREIGQFKVTLCLLYLRTFKKLIILYIIICYYFNHTIIVFIYHKVYITYS